MKPPPPIGQVEPLPAGTDLGAARYKQSQIRKLAATRKRAAAGTLGIVNQATAGALKAIRECEANETRLSDPFERARLHLGRLGIPVFSAAVYDPAFGERTARRLIARAEWVVGDRRVADRVAVMEAARAVGWRG